MFNQPRDKMAGEAAAQHCQIVLEMQDEWEWKKAKGREHLGLREIRRVWARKKEQSITGVLGGEEMDFYKVRSKGEVRGF